MPGSPRLSDLLPMAVLALALLAMHAHGFTLPLVGDDYAFIEKAERSSLAGLLAPAGLLSDFYRPWSRELHFAWLHRAFGLDPRPFHLANFALTFAALALYWSGARRLAGDAAAAVATAGVAALEPWRLLDAWAAGSQDLWMIAWALVVLHAARSRRPFVAAGAFALALLSKETAATLPAIVAAEAMVLRRERPGRALREMAPMLAVAALWAAVHPRLGGAAWYFHATAPAAPDAAGIPPLVRLGRSLLASLQLDRWPAPEHGWPAAAVRAAAPVMLLALLAWTGVRPPRVDREGGPRVALFGAGWALAAWLPLALPSLGWHAYYALFGALGAWLALGVLLARFPALALAAVVAVGVIGTATADTPSHDWGSAWFQARAASFVGRTRAELLRLHPALPRGSRLYFTSVPAGIGLVPGGDDSPALRVWYRDPSLRAAFLSRYTARAANDTAGVDRFFRYDEALGWLELDAGPEDLVSGRTADPCWAADHDMLATAMARAGDWRGAAGEYAKLVEAEPSRSTYAYDLALCQCELGRPGEARRWFDRAATLPDADTALREDARRGCR